MENGDISFNLNGIVLCINLGAGCKMRERVCEEEILQVYCRQLSFEFCTRKLFSSQYYFYLFRLVREASGLMKKFSNSWRVRKSKYSLL